MYLLFYMMPASLTGYRSRNIILVHLNTEHIVQMWYKTKTPSVSAGHARLPSLINMKSQTSFLKRRKSIHANYDCSTSSSNQNSDLSSNLTETWSDFNIPGHQMTRPLSIHQRLLRLLQIHDLNTSLDSQNQ